MRFTTLEEYKIIKIPKRNGKTRVIHEPNHELKKQQRELLLNFIYRNFAVSFFAHGFVRRRNIVTNALPHVNQDYILKLDISDCFPSTSWYRFVTSVRHGQVSNKEFVEKHLDQLKICFIEDGMSTFLPQGAPTSPAIVNIMLYPFDYSVVKYLDNLRLYLEDCGVEDFKNPQYSRYADDITISWKGSRRHWCTIVDKIKHFLVFYGYSINDNKIKVISRSRRQIVCGVVVNEKPTLPKETRRKLRAIKHKLSLGELELTNEIRGLLSFEHMINQWDKFPVNSIENWKNLHEVRSMINDK